MSDKVIIKNVSTAIVHLSFPNINWNRELIPGRAVPATKDEYDEMTFDPGFVSLIDGHYISISGLDEDEQVREVSEVFEASKISEMLDKGDITSFAKFIPKATEAEKESVIQLAVDKGITNQGFVALIKKYCDVDIINAINMKHQAEEK